MKALLVSDQPSVTIGAPTTNPPSLSVNLPRAVGFVLFSSWPLRDRRPQERLEQASWWLVEEILMERK